MRRAVGVMTSAALTFICAAVVYGATLPPLLSSPDLGSQLMRRVFGESTDTTASFAAASNNRTSEWPLRDLALEVRSSSSLAGLAFALAFTPADPPASEKSETLAASSAFDSAMLRNSFVAPALPNDLTAATAILPATYQPVAPEIKISPEPGTLAFGPLADGADDGLTAAAPSSSTTAPLQVGAVRFQGNVNGSSTEASTEALRDNAYGAGANFNVRAGKRNVSIDLSSSYEQINRNDSSTFSSSSLESASSWQLPNADAPLAIPNYADMNRLAVGAGVAVPVVHGVTLNLNYAAERFYGGYGLPGLINLDAINNSYGGKLTFTIPHTAGTLSIGASQNRYLDSVLPVNTYTQTREDVNFTVKF